MTRLTDNYWLKLFNRATDGRLAGFMTLCFHKLTICVLPTNRWALEVKGSTAAVVPMNRWALQGRWSIAAFVRMNRWALQGRWSIAAFLPTDRWIWMWLSHDLYVQPFDRWSCILYVWPMVLYFNDATWLFV